MLNAHSYDYDVYAQGISGWAWRTNLKRDEAVRLAASLAKTEGVCWIKKAGTMKRAEVISETGAITPVLCDDAGFPLCNE